MLNLSVKKIIDKALLLNPFDLILAGPSSFYYCFSYEYVFVFDNSLVKTKPLLLFLPVAVSFKDFIYFSLSLIKIIVSLFSLIFIHDCLVN